MLRTSSNAITAKFIDYPDYGMQLPNIDLILTLSISEIKHKLNCFLWNHFVENYDINNHCTFRFCPFNHCIQLPHHCNFNPLLL